MDFENRRHPMSWRFRKTGWLVGLGIGLVVGLALGGFWPQTPLHAVATDRYETFGIAPGECDEMSEAIYFLDMLSGQLNAIVIGKHPRSNQIIATGHYAANVLADLKVDAAKNPRFLMVTGKADLMRGGRGTAMYYSRSVLYVTEVTTGRVVAYAVPWNATAHASGTFVQLPLARVIAFPIRGAAALGVPAKGKDDG
jgi:hypothetical protein